VGSHPLTDSTYLRVTCVLHDFLRRSGRRRTIRDRWRLGKDWDAPVSIRPMQVHHAADVERRPAREERDRSCAPHPRWMTLLARGAFTVLELGVLAYLVHLVRVGDGGRVGMVPRLGLMHVISGLGSVVGCFSRLEPQSSLSCDVSIEGQGCTLSRGLEDRQCPLVLVLLGPKPRNTTYHDSQSSTPMRLRSVQ